MTNLAANLVQTAARYPDRASVRLDEQVLSYRDLEDMSARAAAWLRGRGVDVGDRVGLMLPNVPEFVGMILEGYGLSETSPVASFNHPDRIRKPGTIGQPISGVEMRVQDNQGKPVQQGEVGEIAVRGHNVMRGYWRRPAETAEVMVDGWFGTGDLGRVDGEGYFSIVDRKKDMIIRGGFNVYPREVEEVLYEHPAVAEAAVIGVTDDIFGEEVAAVVTLKPGASATPDELREHVKGQLAAYKYPRLVWIEAELPHGDTGKILKRAIVVPPRP